MVRVLAKGMESLGLDTSVVNPAAVKGEARVPLDLKRQLVGSAVAQGGLSCLLKLGRGTGLNSDDPTHRALLSAPDAVSLIDRWRRLQTYVHSRHRVELVKFSAAGVALRHRSLTPGEVPRAFEDLVVLGVLLALLEAIGLVDVAAEIAGQWVYPVTVESDLRQLVKDSRTANWRIRWNPHKPPSAATGPAAAPGNLSAMPPASLSDSLLWPETARRCAAILLIDLLQQHTLAELAHSLGTSTRSLQRTLTVAGLSYSSIASEVRLRAAAWWLLESRLPIAEVGFVCGYSDQPHLTRDFKRKIGLTPGLYRLSFTGVHGAALGTRPNMAATRAQAASVQTITAPDGRSNKADSVKPLA